MTASVFDLFKQGVGPSSSHTMGPMTAAARFLDLLRAGGLLGHASRVEVKLYASLALTGRGHATDRAVILGLMGFEPASLDPDAGDLALARAAAEQWLLLGGEQGIGFDEGRDILWAGRERLPQHPNALTFTAFGADGGEIAARTYYSIGGGFIRCEGESEPETRLPEFRYKNMAGLIRLTVKYDIPLIELLMKNESAVTGLSADEINAKLDHLIALMEDSVNRGIHTEGVLPGPIGLQRKAAAFYKRAVHMHQDLDRFLALLNAFSMAVSEENAAGHRIITAPTSGSAGVIPGIIYFLKKYHEGHSGYKCHSVGFCCQRYMQRSL